MILVAVSLAALASPAAAAERPLAGTDWELVSAGGEDFDPSGTSIAFRDHGRMHGVLICHVLSGRYRADPTAGTLQIGRYKAGNGDLLPCSADAGHAGGLFARALRHTRRYDRTEKTLRLLGKHGHTLARLKLVPDAYKVPQPPSAGDI